MFHIHNSVHLSPIPLFADGGFPALLFPLAFVGFFVAVVVGIMILVARYERKRTEALKAVAADLNFEFFPGGNATTLAELSGFGLFQLGRSRALTNLMQGEAESLSISLFEYAYTTGSGKQQHRHVQTVFVAHQAGMQLPGFTLRPQSFWHRVGNLLGSKDIAFDTHPTFSKNYILNGSDEDAIRAVFTETVLDYFSTHLDLHIEVNGERILYYRSDRAKPEEFRDFMAKGFEILNVFATA
jgi:hypothetical protein